MMVRYGFGRAGGGKRHRADGVGQKTLWDEVGPGGVVSVPGTMAGGRGSETFLSDYHRCDYHTRKEFTGYIG